MLEKVRTFGKDVKEHWNTPAEGKYVPFKEYLYVMVGGGCNYSGNKLMEYICFASSCYLMMYHYKLPYLTFSIISLINMPLNYIWCVLTWYIADNLGFMKKKVERTLYIFYSISSIVGILMIIFDVSKLFNPSGAFVTYMNGLEGVNCNSFFKMLGTHILWNGWNGSRNIFWRKRLIPKHGRYKYTLYCDTVPKIIMVFLIGWLPFYNIPDTITRVWVANLLFSAFNLFSFNNVLETCASTISPDRRERIWIRTFPIKLSHLLNSIIAIIIPVFVNMLKDKWADINFFRYIIPITFTVFSCLTFVFASKIKERIPQPPIEKKVDISFWDGAFGIMRNKYKWINTMVGLVDSLGNGMLPIATILYLYTFRLSGLPYSLLVAFISFCGTPPDFFSPYFLKRFSYKQIMIFFQLSRAIGNAAIVLAFLFLGDNVNLCGTVCVLIFVFLEMTKSVPVTAGHDMDTRIADYQMYLSGERVESLSGGIFGWFTSPIISLVSLIIPILLLKYGFNSNWDVLFVDSARTKIIVIPIIIDVIGYVLMAIPYFFWDYDDRKQDLVMAVLKRREEVTNKESEPQDDDSVVAVSSATEQ